MLCSNHHPNPPNQYEATTLILPMNTSLLDNSLYGLLRETMQTKARSTVDFHEKNMK